MTARSTAPRVGALIPVRLASQRLPRKALMSIEGRPVIGHLLDRVFAAREVDPRLVFVCTTTDPEDDDLVAVVEPLGGQVFRGSRDDLIDRLCRARAAAGMEIALQVDGDDPCADPGYMDRLVRCLLDDQKADVAVVDGLPLGIAAKAMRASAFEAVRAAYRTHNNDTGFSYYFTRSGLCTVRTLQADTGDRDPVSRLTLDYEEDLTFFRALFAALYVPGEVFGVREILDYLRAHPDLRDVNTGRTTEYWQRTAARIYLEFESPGSGARQVIE